MRGYLLKEMLQLKYTIAHPQKKSICAVYI